MAITVKNNLHKELKKDVSNVRVGIDSEGKGYLIKIKEEPIVVEQPKKIKRGKKK